MTSDQLHIAELRALQVVVAGFMKAVDDTLFVKTAAQWKWALDIYAALSRQVSHHPELDPVISAMTSFLARAPLAPSATPPPSTPVTASTSSEPAPIVPAPMNGTPNAPAVNG